MAGLSLEVRSSLVHRVERLILDGKSCLTPVDGRILRALAFDFHSGKTGRTDPGYRALAKKARCALSTVSASIHRLVRAGAISFERRKVKVQDRWLRWTHAYQLLDLSRSGMPTEPLQKKKKEGAQRSVEAQLRYLEAWTRQYVPKAV